MTKNDNTDELLYRLALNLVPGVGPRVGRNLLEHYKTAVNIFKAPLKDLKRFDLINEERARGFKDKEIFSAAERELIFIMRHKIRVLCCDDTAYPMRLNQCNDAPLLMYYKGNADLNSEKMVAIVGTRKNTEYGVKLCEDLVEGLQGQENMVIVSGLASGIDSISHKKSVDLNIPTVGVLAHGLDRIYPVSNKNLSNEMVKNGGVLTEYVSGTIAERTNFPMRNRIVAGMSDVTIVVESDVAGGALITAHLASGYNREVMAFPGRVGDSRSAGCNELIRKNIASVITKADDLLELMNWNKSRKIKVVQKKLLLNFTPEEQKIMDLLQRKQSVHADELLNETGLNSSLLAATLLGLEMQGLLKSLPGKHYRAS